MTCAPTATVMAAAPKMPVKSGFSLILKNILASVLMVMAMALSNGLASIANKIVSA